MQIILDYKNNGYYLSIIDGNTKKSTNRINKINDIINQITEQALTAKVKNNYDLDITFTSYTLTLKNIKKNRNKQLYNDILNKINYNPTKRINRVKNINCKRLATLALSAFVLLSSTSIAKALDGDKKDNVEVQNSIVLKTDIVIDDNIQIEEDINTLTINKEEMLLRLDNNYNDINEYTFNKMNKFIKSDVGQYCFDCCIEYGVDPYLYTSLLVKESGLNHDETIPGGKFYNGYGVGISQLESPSGQEIKAFNYKTNQEEVIYETMENALDEKTNIKIGIMRFQKYLNRYNGNIYLALQAYNYGFGAIDLIVSVYADELNVTKEDIYNSSDIGWMKFVEEIHSNPNMFAQIMSTKTDEHKSAIEYLKNWNYGTYGDDNYIESVLTNYIGDESVNVVNGNQVSFKIKNSNQKTV